ncbi:MAG: hypothetical protein ACKVS7_04310 [Gemmatimonadaceae bacterium]
MTYPSRIRSLTNGLGLEIEKLIRQLPGADPHLRGDPDPDFRSTLTHSLAPDQTIDERSPLDPSLIAPERRRSGAMHAPLSPNGSSAAVRSQPRASAALKAAQDQRFVLFGVWMRTTAAVGLGTAVLYWPYANDCGMLLHLYMGVVAAVLISGGWASITAWRSRVAPAHVMALVVFFWGIVLAAEQVLPRIGYAALRATWMCGG